jgi:hypothetical protein
VVPHSFHANEYKLLVGKSEAKRLFGSPRCNWEDNIKTNLKGTELEGMD